MGYLFGQLTHNATGKSRLLLNAIFARIYHSIFTSSRRFIIPDTRKKSFLRRTLSRVLWKITLKWVLIVSRLGSSVPSLLLYFAFTTHTTPPHTPFAHTHTTPRCTPPHCTPPNNSGKWYFQGSSHLLFLFLLSRQAAQQLAPRPFPFTQTDRTDRTDGW